METGKEVAKRMRARDKRNWHIGRFADEVEKMKLVGRNELEKILPDWVSGFEITSVLRMEAI